MTSCLHTASGQRELRRQAGRCAYDDTSIAQSSSGSADTQTRHCRPKLETDQVTAADGLRLVPGDVSCARPQPLRMLGAVPPPPWALRCTPDGRSRQAPSPKTANRCTGRRASSAARHSLQLQIGLGAAHPLATRPRCQKSNPADQARQEAQITPPSAAQHACLAGVRPAARPRLSGHAKPPIRRRTSARHRRPDRPATAPRPRPDCRGLRSAGTRRGTSAACGPPRSAPSGPSPGAT